MATRSSRRHEFEFPDDPSMHVSREMIYSSKAEASWESHFRTHSFGTPSTSISTATAATRFSNVRQMRASAHIQYHCGTTLPKEQTWGAIPDDAITTIHPTI